MNAALDIKPTDDTLALIAFLMGGHWIYADELRHQIAHLGFEVPSSQWVVGRLSAMTKESAPRFECKIEQPGFRIYRVTHWAETGLGNAWKGFERRRTSEDHAAAATRLGLARDHQEEAPR